MLTIIQCLDCKETMAYPCDTAPWKCAKCGGQRPHVLSVPIKKRGQYEKVPEVRHAKNKLA